MARSPKANAAPTFVIPMAAVSVTELPEGDEWPYELKLDGYRAILIKDGAAARLLSRNEKDLTRMYPRVAVGGTETSR